MIVNKLDMFGVEELMVEYGLCGKHMNLNLEIE
jgi:hypothetical protein